ncbi:autophagy-like protein 9 [Sesbania bispinosa]|nr:autophagy-like protein 9 [Sesbania bispinosa]
MGGLQFGRVVLQHATNKLCGSGAMNEVNTDRNETTNHQKESNERAMRCYRWWSKGDGRIKSTKDSFDSSKPD